MPFIGLREGKSGDAYERHYQLSTLGYLLERHLRCSFEPEAVGTPQSLPPAGWADFPGLRSWEVVLDPRTDLLLSEEVTVLNLADPASYVFFAGTIFLLGICRYLLVTYLVKTAMERGQKIEVNSGRFRFDIKYDPDESDQNALNEGTDTETSSPVSSAGCHKA